MHNSHEHLMGLAVWHGDKSDGPLQFHRLFSGKRICKCSLRKQENHYQLMHQETEHKEIADQNSSSGYFGWDRSSTWKLESYSCASAYEN